MYFFWKSSRWIETIQILEVMTATGTVAVADSLEDKGIMDVRVKSLYANMLSSCKNKSSLETL